jgi:acyl-CoA thioester hydrolase
MSVLLTTKTIVKEWTDYNNHMNLSYYILVFDMGAEKILSKFQMGEHSAKTSKRSTMVVETNTTYQKEVKEGDEVDVYLVHLDHDNKRLHYKLEMFDKTKNILSATTEVLALYIDLNNRKVTEFEIKKIKMIDDYIEQNKSNFNTRGLKLSSKLKK